MSAPLVSVIMPVHNAAPFVGAAIRSVLAQTQPDFELLLVDDASTDGSGKVIASFQDERLRCRRSEVPLNAAGARNLALAEAKGEFVAFLDADDVAQSDRLALQIEALRTQPELGLIGSLVQVIDEHGVVVGDGFVRPLAPDEIAPQLLFGNCLALSSIMARRAVLKPFQPEFAPAEDYELWTRLVNETGIGILPYVLTSYRVHPGGVSARQTERMQMAVAAIHTAQLARLGLEPAPIHAQMAAWPVEPTMAQLREAHAWLGRLAKANARTEVYPYALFQQVLADKWFTLCLDSWWLGWPVWAVFHRSPLAAPTVREALQLFRRLAVRFLQS